MELPVNCAARACAEAFIGQSEGDITLAAAQSGRCKGPFYDVTLRVAAAYPPDVMTDGMKYFDRLAVGTLVEGYEALD